jgi:hypothetical protein
MAIFQLRVQASTINNLEQATFLIIMTKNNENNGTKHPTIFTYSSVIDMQKIHVNCDMKGADGKHNNRFGTNGNMACELRHICS